MSTKTMSVLLVDDDPQTRDIFQLVMDHHELPLTVMKDAETALDHLKTHTHDVVVMDLFLPGLDGYQALDQIRKSENNATCKVIATTAYYTTDTKQEVLNRGFDGYMPKPFTSQKLVPFLRSIIEQD